MRDQTHLVYNRDYDHPSFSEILEEAREPIEKTDPLVKRVCEEVVLKRPMRIFFHQIALGIKPGQTSSASIAPKPLPLWQSTLIWIGMFPRPLEYIYRLEVPKQD